MCSLQLARWYGGTCSNGPLPSRYSQTFRDDHNTSHHFHFRLVVCEYALQICCLQLVCPRYSGWRRQRSRRLRSSYSLECLDIWHQLSCWMSSSFNLHVTLYVDVHRSMCWEALLSRSCSSFTPFTSFYRRLTRCCVSRLQYLQLSVLLGLKLRQVERREIRRTFIPVVTSSACGNVPVRHGSWILLECLSHVRKPRQRSTTSAHIVVYVLLVLPSSAPQCGSLQAIYPTDIVNSSRWISGMLSRLHSLRTPSIPDLHTAPSELRRIRPEGQQQWLSSSPAWWW